jgi:hypothetical protein
MFGNSDNPCSDYYHVSVSPLQYLGYFPIPRNMYGDEGVKKVMLGSVL